MMSDFFYRGSSVNNSRVTRPVSRRVFAWLATIAIVGSIVSTGFVISARQHFEAVTIGYQSEQLRQQTSELDEKLRKLELERAQAYAPGALERRARALGLARTGTGNGIRRPASRTR